MAGAYCKRIINGGYSAFAEAMESNLTAAKASGRIKAEKADELFDRFAQIELDAYDRVRDEVAKPLQDAGLLSDDVWRIYAKL